MSKFDNCIHPPLIPESIVLHIAPPALHVLLGLTMDNVGIIGDACERLDKRIADERLSLPEDEKTLAAIQRLQKLETRFGELKRELPVRKRAFVQAKEARAVEIEGNHRSCLISFISWSLFLLEIERSRKTGGCHSARCSTFGDDYTKCYLMIT